MDESDLEVRQHARYEKAQVVLSNPKMLELWGTERLVESLLTSLTAEITAGLSNGQSEKSAWYLDLRTRRKETKHELDTVRAALRRLEREILAHAAESMKCQGASLQEICNKLCVPLHTARSLMAAAKTLRDAKANGDPMSRLPMRQRNRLLAEGISSLEEVGAALESGTLEKVPNLGRRSVEDIRDWYAKETAVLEGIQAPRRETCCRFDGRLRAIGSSQIGSGIRPHHHA